MIVALATTSVSLWGGPVTAAAEDPSASSLLTEMRIDTHSNGIVVRLPRKSVSGASDWTVTTQGAGSRSASAEAGEDLFVPFGESRGFFQAELVAKSPNGELRRAVVGSSVPGIGEEDPPNIRFVRDEQVVLLQWDSPKEGIRWDIRIDGRDVGSTNKPEYLARLGSKNMHRLALSAKVPTGSGVDKPYFGASKFPRRHPQST